MGPRVAAGERAARSPAWWTEGHDLLLTPTIAEPPPPLGTFDSPPDNPLHGLFRAAEVVPFTPPFNVTGQPAISLPLHWNADGPADRRAARRRLRARGPAAAGRRPARGGAALGRPAAAGPRLTPRPPEAIGARRRRWWIASARAGTVSWAVCGMAAVVALLGLIAYVLRVIWPPLILAGAIVFLLNPVVTRLQGRHIPRALGTGLSYLAVVAATGS